MSWIAVGEQLPPIGQLVLVYQNTTGFGLRRLVNDDDVTEWYDENNFLDDSELLVYCWAALPDAPF
jgi:hypothetical protein